MRVLVIMSGVPGTGKSAVAEALAGHLGATLLSVDPIEAALNRSGITREHGEGSHQAAYATMRALADEQLARGHPVVVDAMYGLRAERDALRALAEAHGARAVVVATTCSDRALHRERLAARERRGLEGFLYSATWENVEPHLDGHRVPEDAAVVLDSVDPLDANVARALAVLRART